MPQLTIVYWRDIPVQMIVKADRKSAKRQLSDRYRQATDVAAMRAGATDTDAYLNDRRKGDPVTVDGGIEALADGAVADIYAEYGNDRLKALIDNGGYEGN